jgi:hypothetical protein
MTFRLVSTSGDSCTVKADLGPAISGRFFKLPKQ